jgi:hypothetical protein
MAVHGLQNLAQGTNLALNLVTHNAMRKYDELQARS